MDRFHNSVSRKVRNVSTAAVIAACGVATSAANAQVTLPDPGVDTGGYVTALMTDTGTLYGTIIGAAFGLFLIGWGTKAAMSWFRGRRAGN